MSINKNIQLNGANNSRTLRFFDLWILFSYETPVAFMQHHDRMLIRRKNEWGPTTGKHINMFIKDYLTIGNLQTYERPDFEDSLYAELNKAVLRNITHRMTKGNA